jgi:hypothetical protein
MLRLSVRDVIALAAWIGVGDRMSKRRSFAIWVFEMVCEAVGTCLWITAAAFIYADPGLHNDLSFRLIFGISAFVLIEFALTGYLLTTVISALYLPRRQRFLYPLVSGSLYLIHSGIFFVAVGNHVFDKHNLFIQVGGASITFAVTLVGDRLRGLPELIARPPGSDDNPMELMR